MSQLKALKAATTLTDVAHLLDTKPSALSYLLYKKPKSTLYKKFEIPKRYGGVREICAPEKELRLVQRRLSDFLQKCIEEINALRGRIENEKSPGISHGFKRKHSIMSNARVHKTRRYVFNADLQDFFGSIHIGRVIGFFAKDKNFGLHPKVALLLAQIACHEAKLPQGSPCSPVVSNLIGHVLDVQLVRLALANDCIYTRYADDLTFSSNKNPFPRKIALPVEGKEHGFTSGSSLKRIVERSGFRFNEEKTRLQYRDSRQEVTGLTVNRKINSRVEYRSTVRAMVHSLIKTGSFEYVYKTKDPAGTKIVFREPGSRPELRGMLAFIDHVDQFNVKLYKGEHPVPPACASREKVFKQFMLFDGFYATELPVILCEGETDNIYLTHAAHQLCALFPKLVSTDASGKKKLSIRLHKYSNKTTGRILQLKGGTGQIASFVIEYHKHISCIFQAPGGTHPVIILLDNDCGKGSVTKAIEKLSKTPIDWMAPFIHIVGNLYVVLTPLIPPATESYIEDCFQPETLAIPHHGKKFNPAKKIDALKEYGKMVFAKEVIRPNAGKINFQGFQPLLERLESVIHAHAQKVAAAPVVAVAKAPSLAVAVP